MPGKLSDLAALTGAGAALTDTVEVRDISDTSMAPTGTNKVMTWQEIINFLGPQMPAPAGTNEVFVGPSDPGVGAGYEMWFDSDATGPSSMVETAADGALQLGAIAAPVAVPISPKAKIVNLAIGNRSWPFVINNAERPVLVAPGWMHTAMYANYNTTTFNTIGLPTQSSQGTSTAAAPASTTTQTRQRRIENLATASSSAVAGQRMTQSPPMVISDGMYGGGLFVFRWGPATGVTIGTHRAFCGFRLATGIPADVDASTQTDCVGMGWDSADTQVQMMCNDATGTCTKVALGASFPKPSLDRTTWYEMILYCPPDVASEVNYMVTDVGSGAVATGALTSDLSAPIITALHAVVWFAVGGTNSVIGTAIQSWDFWNP